MCLILYRPNGVDNLVFYEIVNGQTEPTNKDFMFILESGSKSTSLKLDKQLDYESVSRYTLTIRATVSNSKGLVFNDQYAIF